MKTTWLYIFYILFLFVSCSKDPSSNGNGNGNGEEEEEEEEIGIDFKIGKECIIGGSTYIIDSISFEKVGKGVAYAYMQIKDTKFPLVMHAIEINNEKAELDIETWIGKDSIRGRETPLAFANRKEVAAAINGDFFDMTGPTAGMPLGGEMYRGVLTKSPANNEPLIAFNKDNSPFADFIKLEGRLIKGFKAWGLSGVNIPREANSLVLYNSFYGNNTRTNEWGEELLLAPVASNWDELGNYRNVKCKVEKIVHIDNGGAMPIPKGKIVISGHGTTVEYLKDFKVGDELTIDLNFIYASDNTSANEVYNMIGSHTVILKKSVYTGINDDIAKNRHPRTAVGFTNNKVYFVVVEGRREGISLGVKNSELADILLHLGAENGVNLDGGVSSCMIVDGKVKNTIPGGTQRAVANGLALVKKKN